jgi:DNA invertase Pin-like site-specific DNA recombinase
LGAGFVSLIEALDLTIPGSRSLDGTEAVLAEFERENPRECAGIAQARN